MPQLLKKETPSFSGLLGLNEKVTTLIKLFLQEFKLQIPYINCIFIP